MRFIVLLGVVSFFAMFIAYNTNYVNVAIPFITTFYNIPIFLVILFSFGVGIIFQMLASSFFGKSKTKKK